MSHVAGLRLPKKELEKYQTSSPTTHGETMGILPATYLTQLLLIAPMGAGRANTHSDIS